MGPVFEHFLDHFWGHFGIYFGIRSGQEGAKMFPRGPSKTPKTQKAAFAKTMRFEGSQEPPKDLQNPTKKESKNGPQNYKFLDQFWGQKLLQKGGKNETTFGSPRPCISGVHKMPNQELNERVAKGTGAGIILSKRKGGIKPLKSF